jgi:hypothetical protein
MQGQGYYQGNTAKAVVTVSVVVQGNWKAWMPGWMAMEIYWI